MRRRINALVVAAGLVATVTAPDARAASVRVDGGRTSVALDPAALAAAGLTVSGVSGGTQSPGDLPDSVAFPVTPRDGAERPTTFTYDPADFLGTFSGTIEHRGSVLFNDGSIEAGDFTIGFDAARAGTLGGAASGFYVRSNAGLDATLFDVAAPDALSAGESALTIDADLLVSPEFAALLRNAGLATADLTGADAGDAGVSATANAVPIPAPAALGVVGLGIVGFAVRRRNGADRTV